jgi:hypothetical protein
VYDDEDAEKMFRYWTAVHGLVPKMVMLEYNNGPFKLLCDDFSPANMIVNNADDLEIIAVVDWEWSYASPMQLCWSPPRWLLLQPPHLWEWDRLDRYKHCFHLYLSMLEREEQHWWIPEGDADVKPSLLMRKLWEDGKVWFHQILTGCVDYLSDVPYIELQRIEPDLDVLAKAVSVSEVERFIDTKQEQKELYQDQIAAKLADVNKRSVVELEKMEKCRIKSPPVDP